MWININKKIKTIFIYKPKAFQEHSFLFTFCIVSSLLVKELIFFYSPYWREKISPFLLFLPLFLHFRREILFFNVSFCIIFSLLAKKYSKNVTNSNFFLTIRNPKIIWKYIMEDLKESYFIHFPHYFLTSGKDKNINIFPLPMKKIFLKFLSLDRVFKTFKWWIS